MMTVRKSHASPPEGPKRARAAKRRTLGPLTYRLFGNTVREIADGWAKLATRYGRDYSLQGRMLRGGPMLNVIALHFMLMSDAQRREILRETVPKLEALLAGRENLQEFLGMIDGEKVPTWAAAINASPNAEIDAEIASEAR